MFGVHRITSARSRPPRESGFDDEALLERFGELEVQKYQEVGKGTKAGEIHVKVLLGGSGKVVAVVGRFFSQRAIRSDAGGRAGTFIAEL